MPTQMQRCLESGDIQGAMALMAQIAPHVPQPQTWAEAEATFHRARTAASSVRFSARAYSHAWLAERAMPSALPDWLRPRADQLYPKVVEGVGIAVRGPGHKRALALALRSAMEQAVAECYADGKTEPEFVRARMADARTKVLRGD